MPCLLEWGEEIDFSCSSVAETVFLMSLLLTLYLLLWWYLILMFQNRQVIVTSLAVVGIWGGGCGGGGGGCPPESQLLEFLQRPGEDGCGLKEFFIFDGGCLGKVTGSKKEVVVVKMVVGVVERLVWARLGVLLEVIILV